MYGGFGSHRGWRCLIPAFLMLTPLLIRPLLHRNEKKKLYSAEVNQRRGSFTPIIATCEGILDREAESYVKRLAFHLSNKWQKSQSQTIFWVRARIQICILRSVSNCFRGSRTKWRGGNVEDGVGMLRMED